ncbi:MULTISPECIES: sigma-70 family RNA polymerase sigma factor [Rhodobacterales]|uniref:sigma-70 family RNA polymerase sigma factor n=1 Tax=Rhodobacterales TaxID=204455 RepID=UPI00237FB490|nr:sigma-70 family RNA polymerase sigma factor [Phaeobacter gallaeciensis]MDE4097986.1 sigma-70 family RNA polymerase sigma factor [Phaeobacter gallaeciensis]MDE4106755.1 sigma-70 family RNA polymerase sigma factor [Phaeobacter gallaeciensis]MDE4111209.1 sigma-70 family RNA polymerase sigma factor [Phaeobacter gallaeciensis]MDE4115721.1 sigma-70 family RNA polymerase sigma factor [Phaeobacter gallaeciensis]MDE4120150.1 sigma-70 family RNA polymerase sigma factor [Phaeobacter gallaeciensis]
MTTPAEIETMIARIALRDRRAFAALYDATSAKLFGVCLRVLKNRGEAEDTLQEVFLRIWAKADSYAVTGHSPMTWLITIARNLSIDRLRSRQARMSGQGDGGDLLEQVPDSSPGPEATTIARSEQARMNACMEELPQDRAEAVRGAYLEGDNYQTLAERHGVPLNTMRTWLRRSLQKLKECLTR